MTSRIELGSGEIHLWLALYDGIDDESLHAAYRQLLSAEERDAEPKFYFARDRRRYLVTRALVRTVLSRYGRIEPCDWVFSTNAYGRPEIVNGDTLDGNVSFNISHTHSLIVLGVARNRVLGVDVENFAARRVSIDIAERFFAAAEVASLRRVLPHQQQYRFFEYWTFKESYIKARGMGLSLPLDKFSFHYPDERKVEIAIHPTLEDDPSRWRFWQFRPGPEYLLALCAESAGKLVPNVRIRQIVPLKYEQVLVMAPSRTSE